MSQNEDDPLNKMRFWADQLYPTRHISDDTLKELLTWGADEIERYREHIASQLPPHMAALARKGEFPLKPNSA